MAREGSAIDRLVRFCLENKLPVVLLAGFLAFWGVLVAPFAWDIEGVPRDPVPVDAIPDTGENQQIVFTSWPGRSPQDVEDQVTYPLTVALLGVPGVKTIRSNSMLGFSSIFVIFDDDVEFYWSRTRILEKLGSLRDGTLPDGVQPTLGPDATSLGQVFWYTLEGRDPDGKPTGGWGLDELRTAQDWYVRYGLASVEGVAEVASVGGYVREYQIDVDPDAMRAHGVTLEQVFAAVRMSNVDVGARTIEVNRAEYVVRGLGFLRSLEDIEATVVKVSDNVPVTIRQIAHVSTGPAMRRGALDKAGTEAVGGVVVVRYGSNPLAVIERVKAKIEELAPGLPRKVLDDGKESRVTVVPFYDRTQLIHETLGTLGDALRDEVLVTIIVVLVMVAHLSSAVLISGLLPLAVLMCFIAMKYVGVDANIVALSGIAIAIGTMVDMGVVITENVLRHLRDATTRAERKEAVFAATSEVGGAVLTSVLTTIVSFLPVFAMEGAEGKLFKPLAYTKTFALLAAIAVALVVIPPLAHLILRSTRRASRRFRIGAGLHLGIALAVGLVLAHTWAPLGPSERFANVVVTLALLSGFLLVFWVLQRAYEPILRFCLRFKALCLMFPIALCVLGVTIWLGAPRVFGFVERGTDEKGNPVGLFADLDASFPGLGSEFMPKLDEGAFLLMPVTMYHASIGEALELLQIQDRAIRAIPEVESVVGKIGRVESPLDPAPVGMVETVITYKSEFRTDEAGHPLRFRYDHAKGEHVLDGDLELIPDDDGEPFRQWRGHISSPRDIWDEIAAAAQVPGMTTASMLQPIETRRIMLQTGMRAPFGVKIQGPDLETIERVGLEIERILKRVPSVNAATVSADRIVGKPYLEIEIDRQAIARHGLHVRDVQDVIEVAIGGRQLTTTVEGRERYPVRVRYQRELRDRIDMLGRILVAGRDGVQVPLGQLAELRYTAGPQTIKSEDTFLTGAVIFDKLPDSAEVEVVDECRRFLDAAIDSGELVLPAGVNYRFAGEYENQVRATERLRIVLPLALFLIFMILWFQFRSVVSTCVVFSGVFVAWSGGFLLLWLYGQDWFLSFEVFGADLRELFQVGTVNLSVAVWVGFLALFGIATDDGVIMTTYLKQSVDRAQPTTRQEIRDAVVAAGKRRIRPCLMTTATTVLALLPVLTSTGRGSDVMVPMAIPSFGGMLVVVITVFVVPTLDCAVREFRLRRVAR
ncbi:MAG: efflux RND transporter permease subunit [Planctomycetes bacterium]|nr:efflux RND transporter permease subunit [Planctomycetota bacterium]